MLGLSLFNFALLNPKGIIALHERDLMVTSVLIMLIVVVPAYFLLFRFAIKYNAKNTSIKTPEDNKSSKHAWFFWIAPAVIVFFLSLITWQTTHALDPYKPIVSDNKPITIQVVALNWKWLFIYPEQHIATVNFIQIPVNTPVHFDLTADAPMNSFWIPQLGGQIYAMPGMSTQHNLMATEEGDFAGSAAEINGAGFSGMKFITRSSSQEAFDQWLETVKQATTTLTREEYELLAKPSENTPVTFYSSVDENMYTSVIQKFMPAAEQMGDVNTNAMPAMNN